MKKASGIVGNLPAWAMWAAAAVLWSAVVAVAPQGVARARFVVEPTPTPAKLSQHAESEAGRQRQPAGAMVQLGVTSAPPGARPAAKPLA
ncbi:MAG: hypothetical protein HY699_12875 [Deltaproteobacteria bacterium]|nr:hypothetical protein [Deltaproteobacteria bacterium]